MSEHTYRIVEIVGTSPDGIDAAIRNGESRASSTLRGLDWFDVQSVRGELADGQVAHFQVTLKVGFASRRVTPRASEPAPGRESNIEAWSW